MAFQLSPGINVSEIDLTTVVPSVATSIGAVAGNFAWGPANEVITISDEVRLADSDLRCIAHVVPCAVVRVYRHCHCSDSAVLVAGRVAVSGVAQGPGGPVAPVPPDLYRITVWVRH